MRNEGKYNAVNVAWRLEEIETGTRLTVDARVRLKGFFKIVGLVLHPIFKRKAMNQLEAELDTLKELCEGEKNNRNGCMFGFEVKILLVKKGIF